MPPIPQSIVQHTAGLYLPASLSSGLQQLPKSRSYIFVDVIRARPHSTAHRFVFDMRPTPDNVLFLLV
jgi:hypothetical protein